MINLIFLLFTVESNYRFLKDRTQWHGFMVEENNLGRSGYVINEGDYSETCLPHFRQKMKSEQRQWPSQWRRVQISKTF